MHMFLISETFSAAFADNATGAQLVNRINNSLSEFESNVKQLTSRLRDLELNAKLTKHP